MRETSLPDLAREALSCGFRRKVNYLENLLQDLGYAWRMFRRAPGFAVIAVVTLALGIGVNTAIFSTADAALLRALPYTDPDRLVMLWQDGSLLGSGRNWPSPGDFEDWRKRNHVFTDMAAIRTVSATLTGDSAPEQVFGRRVTANFFSVLGVRPVLGRTFTPEEELQRAPVAVVSYGLWRQYYKGDPRIIGKQIVLDGSRVAVIGVLPRGFALQRRDVSYWAPASFSAGDLQNRTAHSLYVIARLKSDVNISRARADMREIGAAIAAEYPERQRMGVAVSELKEELLGNARIGLLVLLAAAGCVLLIACANLASLLLARAVSRQREISIRAAMGAGRGRLVRQMIAEGLLLSVAAGALGVAIAPAGIGIFEKLVPPTLPPSAAARVDQRVVAYTALLSLATGLLFSLVPALEAGRRSPIDSLKQDGRAGTGIRGHKVRDVLVTAEVALALVLLAGAGLMLKTVANLQGSTLGFRSDHLLTLRTVLAPKYRDVAARLGFTNRVLEGVRSLPGVLGAGYVSTLPFESRGDTVGYRIEGRPLPPNDPGEALYRVVTGDYLAVLGARLREGRFVNSSDGEAAPPVVLLNESFARQYWPNESSLGHRIALAYGEGTVWRTVVGVVGDLRERGYELAMKPAIYQPDAQAVRQTRDLIVRTAGDPLSIAPSVRRVIAAADPEQPVTWVRTMDEMIDSDVADRRQISTLLVIFAALALLLACIGLYGILSYVVTQRRRELGLRMALGATAASVQRMVVMRGLIPATIGLVTGLSASLALTGLMQGLLYGVDAGDPWFLTGVVVLLGIVSASACWFPARRASRLDPMLVLGED